QSLPELAVLARHAEIVVGVDTGLTHLAAALGTPTAAIFPTTHPPARGGGGARPAPPRRGARHAHRGDLHHDRSAARGRGEHRPARTRCGWQRRCPVVARNRGRLRTTVAASTAQIKEREEKEEGQRAS